jgi:hypothetical protein
MFYHFLREELVADGKVPWRDFSLQFGRPDGELKDDGDEPPSRFCVPDSEPRWFRCDGDDDDDREQKRPRSHGIMHQVSSWFDGRGRSKHMGADGDRGNGWYVGESSRGRHHAQHEKSTPPAREASPPDERRALRRLW